MDLAFVMLQRSMVYVPHFLYWLTVTVANLLPNPTELISIAEWSISYLLPSFRDNLVYFLLECLSQLRGGTLAIFIIHSIR